MAKKPSNSNNAPDLELEPDAWERFERTVDKVVPPKSGEQVPGHRSPDKGRAPKS
jgi:hypothetical protein